MKYTFYIFVIIFWVSCTPVEEAPQENDVELAQVFNKKLYLSELSGMVPEGASKEDSIKIIHAEVEVWTRETLLMHEAEKSIPQDLNIDDLVRDYRMSLIRHNYEQLLVETQLDSIVSEQELNNYYEKNKEQYQLRSSIFRCLLMKVPKDAPNLQELKNWWPGSKPENFQKMKNYAAQYATFYILEDSTWYSPHEVRSQLPNGVSFNANQNLIQADNQFQYFFKVLEKKSEKEIAPLGYIQEQAKKVILHKRKMVLLDKRKEELYERETNKRNVKIYTQ